MASYLQQVFRTIGNKPTSSQYRHLPMINSLVSTFSNYLSSRGQIAKKQTLMRWYKGIPELTALCNKVAGDIVYKWHFESVDPKKDNRNKILKANRFAQEILLDKTMFSQVIDILVTGEGFGWIGKITDKQLKEAILENLKWKIGIEKKEKKELSEQIFEEIKAVEGFSGNDFNDEDLLRPRKYRSVASTTIEIVYDQWDIKNYNHIVGIQKPVVFTPKEIVHFTFMDVDGKPNGFTPVESILVQLELLRQMWQNQLSLHKNGGYPDKIFVLKNMRVGTPDYKRIEQQLEKYKLVENKHGNLLFTGDIGVEELQQLDSMQFKEVGLYITGLVAMQWQIPKTSIPYIVGGQQRTNDTGGDAERGYWRKVEYAQKLFSETMNTQFWIPYFGVKIVFDNPYPQIDVQKETMRQLMVNNLLVENELLGINDKQLSNDVIMKKLGYTESDLTKKKEEEMGMTQFGMNNQTSRNQMTDSQRNVSSSKRTEQLSTIQSRGMKPTGVGKELDKAAELEYKETLGVNAIEVDLKNFIRLYNEDKMYHPTKPPRIFIKKNEERIILMYKSTDFVYKTKIQNSDVNSNRIWLMNLDSKYVYKV